MVNVSALPQVVAAITGITNNAGGPITITTADTGTLAIGDLVTISGVTDCGHQRPVARHECQGEND